MVQELKPEMIEQEILKNSAEMPEKNANILVVGATGAGKSSLVNHIFGIDFAKTGTGKPVTQETKKYEVDGVPITLFDTKGYELASKEHKRFLEEMQTYIHDENVKAEDQIHMIWYVIAASGDRITDMDLEMLRQFKASGKPVCVVLTKCDLISQENLEAMQKVLASVNIDNFYVSVNLKQMKYLQMAELIEWTYSKIDDSVKWSFLRAEKAHLELKRKEVASYIRQHTAASFGVGFSPIPFSDGPFLLLNQGAMIMRILKVYNLGAVGDQMKTLVSSMGIGQVVSQFARYTIAQVLKLFPGLGTVAGGMINGAVASAITASIGLAVSEVAYLAAKARIDDENLDVLDFLKNNVSPEMLKDLFEKFMHQEMKK